jgi:histidinol-phosphatase (PHP family)
VVLPADSHVHSEWSWDAPRGAMERTCARAVEIGLPAVAFTEHADYTRWDVTTSELDGLEHFQRLVAPDDTLTPPKLDLAGYLECVQRCRNQFPGLRIISGVEIGEPHRHRDGISTLIDAGRFDRVLGSLHCVPLDGRFLPPRSLYRRRPAADVLRLYLAELTQLVATSDVFEVLAHIDFPLRHWPAEAGAFEPATFEAEFRHVLRTLAEGERVLELNTSVPLHPEIVRWWGEEGGSAITFGSDAHDPSRLAHGFAAASAVAEAHGFRAGRHPYDVWTRRRT